MARWTLREIETLPTVSDGEPGDPAWYPLQHALGIDTFGANLFVATADGQALAGDHDERASKQQELYLVLESQATFMLDSDEVTAGRGAALGDIPRPA